MAEARIAELLQKDSSILQDEARKRLLAWSEEASQKSSEHLRVSIALGRKQKLLGIMSLLLVLLGLTVATVDASGMWSKVVSDTNVFSRAKDSVAWFLAIAGLVISTTSEGMEYPKRAELHKQAHKAFDSLRIEVETVLLSAQLSGRDIDRVVKSYDRALTLAETANPSGK